MDGVIEWEDMPEPIEPHESSCDVGPTGHVWQLTIDEGAMGLTSGCRECDDAILGPVGGEDVYMASRVLGRLVFEPDHPNIGGWHGDVRCDCGWQWRFEAEYVEAFQP